MKTDLLRYKCEIVRSKVNLMVRGYLVGRYPLSYTFEECVEEFCDRVGWDFNMATQEQQNPIDHVIGIISFRRPDYPTVVKTVQAHWLNHPSRRNDENRI